VGWVSEGWKVPEIYVPFELRGDPVGNNHPDEPSIGSLGNELITDFVVDVDRAGATDKGKVSSRELEQSNSLWTRLSVISLPPAPRTVPSLW
jgi:hypothetical protein